MFDAVGGHDVEYVSLQRDEGKEERPEWAQEVCLEDWTDTAAEIAKCDLVISSCTSIAHCSAAMGVPTWVITPVMPYYLWALPGDTSPWYDSVKLFRQEKYGEWNAPFAKLKVELAKEVEHANN
jgi:ADP-heptose:LPS heptosyltransferase